MTEPTKEILDAVFGSKSSGATPEERALSSQRLFVRSVDGIAEERAEAAGRRLSAYEALSTYGFDVLAEVAAEGFAVVVDSPTAAGRLLSERRDKLRLSAHDVARRAGVDEATVDAAERSARLPVADYERIARAIGLDERYVSVSAVPTDGGDEIATRLRHIGEERPRLTRSAVSAISEAAWVASTQIRLEEALGISPADVGIQWSSNYGSAGYPAYHHGQYLAADTRTKLNLGEGPLVPPLRTICEDLLGIPLIQAELGQYIAGVTVQTAGRRAIVVNVEGENTNPYVRRVTIAHELGHLLHDPPRQLQSLRVDEYEELDRPAEQVVDRVEQRANAFAVELIAPQPAVVEEYQAAEEDGVAAVMRRFWIGYTAARYQIWNGLDRTVPFEALTTRNWAPEVECEQQEAFTAYWHPLPDTRITRRGRFSGVVVRAASQGIISWDSAANFLECSEDDVRSNAAVFRDVFPTVFRYR